MQNSFRKKNFANFGFHARRTKRTYKMDEGPEKKMMNEMGSKPAVKLCVREFSVYVKLRDDVCYLLKCKEDAKGQDIMDEVEYFLHLTLGSKVHSVVYQPTLHLFEPEN